MTCSRRYDPPMLKWQTAPGSSPNHQHVFDDFIQGVLDGHLRPGDRLPREEDWASSYGYGRDAVRQAKAQLKYRELIVSPKRSKGTFVADRAVEIVQRVRAGTPGPLTHRPDTDHEVEKPFGAYLADESVRAFLYRDYEYRLRWPTAAEIAAGAFRRDELVIDAIAPDGTVHSYGIFRTTFKIQWDPPQRND